MNDEARPAMQPPERPGGERLPRQLVTNGECEFEGLTLTYDPTPITPGDTYLAERNSGPHLLTCERVIHEDNYVGGYVIPREVAYPFDLAECVKVAINMETP